ncbi:hypothetical protein DFQ26_006354 [Actinomortierella ambigua]|nr:hypothetical protein DFQ26_006354 [Actinomortierella ambigua]
MMLHPGAKHPAGPQLTPHRPPPQRSAAAEGDDQKSNSASSTASSSSASSSSTTSSSASSSTSSSYSPSTTTTHTGTGVGAAGGSGATDPNSASAMAALSRKRGEYLTALAIMRPRVLDYDVHSCSSYSASYLPENIKVSNPQDQSSRWSSGSNNQMQYIMIKLKKMAIARK